MFRWEPEESYLQISAVDGPIGVKIDTDIEKHKIMKNFIAKKLHLIY